MKYSVLLKDNHTKEEVLCPQEFEWNDNNWFWWFEGNMSCDCNRYLEFERAKGNTPDFEKGKCGEEHYTIVKIVLKDGTEIEGETDETKKES